MIIPKKYLILILTLISINCYSQEGAYYKSIIQAIDHTKECPRCKGAKYIHSDGMLLTRTHKICGGRGCYDCNYKGTETYRGEPFDYKCGLCLGTGKNPLMAELNNLGSYRKIYLKNHTKSMAIYDSENDKYYYPSYQLEADFGIIEYLIYNEKTKRVFDQAGNPLFDIGYEDDKLVNFIYCGSNHWIDILRSDIFGENISFNRNIGESIYVAGRDFSGKNGAEGVYNVSVRHHFKIKNPKFPLRLKAVSKVDFDEKINQIDIIERYIVMLYVSLIYNETNLGIKGLADLYNRSANELISNY